MLDTNVIKKDFPIFRHDPSLIYLDSTATSLKPASVIRALRKYYEEYSANIFRGIYRISEMATEAYEATRKSVAEFINAGSPNEVIFTRNTSESLNLLAYAFAAPRVGKGDSLVTTIVEHHSNFVPWQQVAIQKKAKFVALNVNREGRLDPIESAVTKDTKILAITMVSNVLGTAYDVAQMIKEAKRINPDIIAVVDAAQAVPHRSINVRNLGADFIAFSSHKMLGPTGVGVLWGKLHLLEEMKPFLYGGEMIQEVYREKTLFKAPPHKFEAGTPAIGEVIAFKEAIAYLKTLGMDKIADHEHALGKYAADRLRDELPTAHILGPSDRDHCGGTMSFYFDSAHPHDLAHILSEENICVRAGNHCAMPLHNELNINATLRASFYLYNAKEDVEKMISGLKKALKILS